MQDYDQEIILREIEQQGILKPYQQPQEKQVHIVYIKDSFNTANSHNSRQLRYSESRQNTQPFSRQVPILFGLFWLLCIAILLGIEVGD